MTYLLCDIQIGQRDTNQPKAQDSKDQTARFDRRRLPEFGEGTRRAGLRKAACFSLQTTPMA